MLKVSEIFYSFQGEGYLTGNPSLFLRLFGCNLTCPGFSNQNGTLGDIPIHNVESVSEISAEQMSMGCDSRYAWDKEYSHLSVNKGNEDLFNELDKLCDGTGRLRKGARTVDLVITGGEPLIQIKAITSFLTHIYENSSINLTITFETNGTLRIPLRQQGALMSMMDRFDFVFSVSPKLSASGEPFAITHNPKAIESYSNVGLCTFKYVIDPDIENSLEEVEQSLSYLTGNPVYEPTYLMPVGATLEQQQKSLPRVAQLAVDNGYRVSLRAHIYAFGNGAGV